MYPVHKTLLEGFERCVEHKSNTTKSDFTQAFISEQQGLLQYGLYAARLPMAVEKVSELMVVIGRFVRYCTYDIPCSGQTASEPQ